MNENYDTNQPEIPVQNNSTFGSDSGTAFQYNSSSDIPRYGYTPQETRQNYHMPDKQPKKEKKNVGTKIFIALICGVQLLAIIALTFHAAVMLSNNRTNQAKPESASSAEANPTPSEHISLATATYSDNDDDVSQSLDVSDIAEGAMPTMVSITSISVQEIRNYFGLFGYGNSRTREYENTGSGIIISQNEKELLIITNNHVVENAKNLSVCFIDNEICQATVKGTDPNNDLAIVAVKLSDIKAETVSVIKKAVIGDSNILKVGQQVVAIGNALGYGQSVTTGIVSALNRQIDETDAIMIQTDAAINPGNSGGALLNMKGEVIGINSAKFSSTAVEGMGYAISITPATPIIEDLMNRATREKVSGENASYLGLYGEEITAEIAEMYDVPQGIYVTYVDDNSPAQKAGILPKCFVTHFDGIRVTSAVNLENRLQYYAAGETVEITFQVRKNGEFVEKKTTVTLGKASDFTTSNSRNDSDYSFFMFP